MPISLYESVKKQKEENVEIIFRELSFKVGTGKAKIIGVDFVATRAEIAIAILKANVTTLKLKLLRRF